MVDERTVEALCEALEDEYKARAMYSGIIERFGPVRPFVNIVEAEDRHARALLALFQSLGVTPPPDDWAEKIEIPETIERACAEGVAAEIENQAMYERLLAMTDVPAVRAVFLRLQAASRDNHLPAFRRCLEREQKGGEAPRGQRGRRRGRC
jgi:rubrerythrin